MSVSGRIFRRKDRKSWYCKLDGKFVSLGVNEAETLKKWHELCADHNPDSRITTKALLKRYLTWMKANQAASSYEFAERACKGCGRWKGFGIVCGRVPAKTIKPHHVTEWVDATFGHRQNNTRRRYLGTVQRAFSFPNVVSQACRQCFLRFR